MGKREKRALEKEQAARQAKRNAVYAALWQQPAYRRMNERLERLNQDVGLALHINNAPPEEVARVKRRFSRYHRRIIAIERAALAAAGFPHG